MYRQATYIRKMEEAPFLFIYKILSYFKYSRLTFSTFCTNMAALSIISFYELLQIQILAYNV